MNNSIRWTIEKSPTFGAHQVAGLSPHTPLMP